VNVEPAIQGTPIFHGRKLLALAPVGAYGGFNTSAHRINALRQLGFGVSVVDGCSSVGGPLLRLRARVRGRLFRMGLPVGSSDLADDNQRLADVACRGAWDVIWLDKALTIKPRTMSILRATNPEAMIIGFSPDDMNARHNQSVEFLNSLPHYDAFITTKTYNVRELAALGARRVIFTDNGYDPDAFKPKDVGVAECRAFGGDVGFIGSFEHERATLMHHLASNGISVRVWGEGWDRCRLKHHNLNIENRSLYSSSFAVAVSAFKINLGFLRKINRDQQTTRSVEIPACGGFMLAERTEEHLGLFEEGREAEFFGSPDELLEKCQRYLSDDEGRARIARLGRERCINFGYSNKDRLRVALTKVLPP